MKLSGKAGSLETLKAMGLNVPHWEVLIHHQALDKFLKRLKPFAESYAVRSSAIAEDGLHHSFAGLFDTFLDVSWEELPATIEKCRASLSSDRVQAYAKHADIPKSELAVNVIIQQMLHPRSAGVLFTALPDGNINQMLVEAVPGLGLAVVDGSSPVERWSYDRITSKWTCLASPYPQHCLKQADLAALVETVKIIEAHESGFFDIEYAFDEKLWLLQKRPITTLSGKKLKLYDGANIQENYPGQNTPLTFCALRRGYEANFTQLLSELGVSPDVLRQLRTALAEMIEPIQGHFYYRLDHWYQVFQVIPGLSAAAIKAFQSMIGTRVSHISLPLRGSYLSGLRLVIELVKGLLFRDVFEERYRRQMILLKAEARERERNGLPPKERWHWAMDWMERSYAILFYPLLNDFYCGVFLYALSQRLKRLKLDVGLVNDVVMGIEEIESAKCVHETQALARMLHSDPLLKQTVRSLTQADRAADFLASSHPFAQRAREYLLRFGERTIEEMKLEIAGFSERPHDFFQHLLRISETEWSLESSVAAEHRRAKAWERWRAIPCGPIEKFLLDTLLRQYIRSLAFREESRFDRVRGKGPFRRAANALGVELFREKKLSDPQDVFWLTFDELTSEAFSQDLIQDRKREWSSRSPLPLRFASLEGQALPRFEAAEIPIGDVTGMGCSSGEAEGDCVVVSDPKEAEVSGKILVAESTDPGWVFLMIQAKGLIVERGNLLSHAAIIGRELGIPTIIGVAAARQRLKGKRVRMNGSSGSVVILEEE